MINQSKIIRGEYDIISLVTTLQGLDFEGGKKYENTVIEVRPLRSKNQNSLMWKWLQEVASYVSGYTGYSKDEIHNHCKVAFLKPTIKDVFGVKQKSYTTTDLTTKEMSEYMDNIYHWATHEVGVTVTHPIDLHAH